jgi:hypothetical protein
LKIRYCRNFLQIPNMYKYTEYRRHTTELNSAFQLLVSFFIFLILPMVCRCLQKECHCIKFLNYLSYFLFPYGLFLDFANHLREVLLPYG